MTIAQIIEAKRDWIENNTDLSCYNEMLKKTKNNKLNPSKKKVLQ